MSNTILLSSEHAWGYLSPDDILCGRNEGEIPLRDLICFQNVCNMASIFLSPLVGLVRGVVAIWAICKISSINQEGCDVDLAAAKSYAWSALGRSVLELFGFGAILGIFVDSIMTLKHQKMCCFANEQ